jgi:hypothetical protein
MKNPSRTILMLLASGLLGSAFFSRPVQAVPINGTIDFGGVVTYDTTSLATATRVNIWNSSIVLQRTGDFTTFVANGNNPLMAAPWIFNSGTPAVPTPGPATPMLWQVGGFTFDLTASQVFSQDTVNGMFLNVTGFGTASGNGFDPTPGLWTFSSTQSNGSNNPTFSFQSQTAVPEASTVILFAIGGACLVAGKLRRRKIKGA